MPNTKKPTSMLRTRLIRLTLTASVSCMAAFSSPAWSQSISLPNSILPEENGDSQQQVQEAPRADWRSGTYGPVPQGQREAMIDGLPPFGANLFTGGFRGAMGEGLNPAYQVKPGDQVTVRAWGAIELDRALPVDAQGNIFLPGIGPINIEGQNSQQVDNSVRRAITSVYSDSVEVYTNLQGVQPVALFVTGNVENPGRYAGTPNDSLLYFLDQAGGIDQGKQQIAEFLFDVCLILLLDFAFEFTQFFAYFVPYLFTAVPVKAHPTHLLLNAVGFNHRWQ